MRENATRFLPLSQAALNIVLALAGEDRHGYAIMQEAARQSGFKYKLGPGTLYDNLQKLVDQGIVEELGQRAGDDDPRRRYYGLSTLGRRVLTAEIARLEGVIRDARYNLRQSKPRRV
jgi:DNA-binding PadR family transcriptional regulator